MIPNLANSKLHRVDTINNTLLVWFGGVEIKEFTLNSLHEETTHTVYPRREGFPSFREVKFKMREIMENKEGAK